ncbi:MAG: PAS domain S-box protein [Chitinophagaceae bacterium]|nr:MAG: PAS domain S-box protein [Chitinophagaceae bacterium]
MTTDDSLLLNIFESTPDWVCIVDKRGWFKRVNPAVQNTLGYSLEELLSVPVSSHIHPDDRQRTGAAREKLINNEPLINFQNRYVAKDGGVIWLHWTSIYMPEKELVFAIAKDITARKKMEIEAEESLRNFKELTAHFKNLAEKDRQFFASELHEELGQLATVVKMDLEWIRSLPLQLSEEPKKRIDHGLATVQTLINKIRKLSYSIDSCQLDELGLDAALRSLCDEFIRTTGILCTYNSSFEEGKLNSEVRLDLLRICQEALANVLHYAQTTEVAIRILEKKGRIDLSVRGNGKSVAHEKAHILAVGNMHRRAASINGEFVLKNNKSSGTTVTVRIKV